jgi:hypothetical protein
MSAKVEILVGEVEGALQVPVQAVTLASGLPRVWVRGAGGDAARPVTLGASSDRFVEVTEGLDEGDVVLLSPPREGPRTDRAQDGEAAPAREGTRGPRDRRPGGEGTGGGTPSAGAGPSAGGAGQGGAGLGPGGAAAVPAPRRGREGTRPPEDAAPRPATEGAAGPRRP